ncbi:hypothetical protein HYC85_021443 [Camellia sinensis]|uniref:Uncharacterized protein n=1 Tax=Camellia sinensis TaxID=4442 RepID=A0A7J7GLJ0_CAMSI|nr:hypothetical protein HYC85_021443 [Camellia sinensis]
MKTHIHATRGMEGRRVGHKPTTEIALPRLPEAPLVPAKGGGGAAERRRRPSGSA